MISTLHTPEQKEGRIARGIEKRTQRIPSDVFMWTAFGSMAASLTLEMMGKHHQALFVGQWAPALLIMGLYNKLVKIAGSEGEAFEFQPSAREIAPRRG